MQMTPEEDIDNYYSNLERILPSIRAQFCYNVDEVGYLEREGAREVNVIVIVDYQMKTCYYSIDQNSKRATAIHCICTDAEFIPRMRVESSPKKNYELNDSNKKRQRLVECQVGSLNLILLLK